jgi:hypothetical protein
LRAGLLVAAPLTVVVALQMLYLQDTLGDDIPVAGEPHNGGATFGNQTRKSPLLAGAIV